MAGPEAQLQTLVRNTLAVLGYTVIETGKARRKVKCPKCWTWHYPTGWQGNTLGCPDLYIHAQHWTAPVAVAIELKTKKGTVRAEQRCMAQQNMTVICRDVESVITTIMRYEESFGSPSQVLKLEKFLEANRTGHRLDVGSTPQ
jgi:hypothetical protein